MAALLLFNEKNPGLLFTRGRWSIGRWRGSVGSGDRVRSQRRNNRTNGRHGKRSVRQGSNGSQRSDGYQGCWVRCVGMGVRSVTGDSDHEERKCKDGLKMDKNKISVSQGSVNRLLNVPNQMVIAGYL